MSQLVPTNRSLWDNLPRRLWPENTKPTAEQFVTWLRGVWTKDSVPIMERIFEQADRGTDCMMRMHQGLIEENHQLRVEVSRLRARLAEIAMVEPPSHRKEYPG